MGYNLGAFVTKITWSPCLLRNSQPFVAQVTWKQLLVVFQHDGDEHHLAVPFYFFGCMQSGFAHLKSKRFVQYIF
jgi:hypothetical protein